MMSGECCLGCLFFGSLVVRASFEKSKTQKADHPDHDDAN